MATPVHTAVLATDKMRTVWPASPEGEPLIMASAGDAAISAPAATSGQVKFKRTVIGAPAGSESDLTGARAGGKPWIIRRAGRRGSSRPPRSIGCGYR